MVNLLDLSFWNGNCDFKKIKSAGYRYVILRAGYRFTKDSKFDEYANACVENNIKFGVYWFDYSLNVEEAILEAKKCLEVIKPYKLDLPVFFDIEYDSIEKAAYKGITITNNMINDFCIAFCEEIKSAGYTPGYYANFDYYNYKFTNKVKSKKYAFWYANYREDRKLYTPSIKCDFFQYSDRGVVSGNGSTHCDLNVCINEKFLNCGGNNSMSNETTKSTINIASDYIQYISSTGVHFISNSGSDERGKSRGGQLGDQTGNEWCLRSWYNRPWNCVLRYSGTTKAAMKLAELGCMAALNNNIGYDQSKRNTYWEELVKANYNPKKIDTPCAEDCSKGVIDNTKAVGYLLGIEELKNINATYTGDMRAAYQKAGFKVLTDAKYLNSPDYLLPGDILLNDVHHTATNITIGRKALSDTTTTNGDSNIKLAQQYLNTITNANLVIDGVPGPKTKAAFSEALQIALNNDYKANLVVDGEVGPKTTEALSKCVVKVGSKGFMVTILEIGLTLKGYNVNGIEIPGIFGSGLKAAVGEFQKHNGLVVDYVAGPKTFSKLF